MHALHHTSEYCPLKSVSSLTQGDQNAGVPLRNTPKGEGGEPAVSAG